MSLKRIAFESLDNEARCAGAKVAFEDGRTLQLAVPPLPADRLTAVDLPGGGGMLRRIDLGCEIGKRVSRLTVEVFAPRS